MKEKLIDIPLPQYASNFDGYILMKFTNRPEFQNDFLDGKLFFNSLDYFSSCERSGQADINEGCTFVVNHENPGLQAVTTKEIDGKLFFVINDYSEHPDDYQPGTIWKYSKAENRNRKIICFYTAFVNVKAQIISDLPNNMRDEFGEYGILILNRQEFFRRLNNAFQEHSSYLEAKMGFVDYQEMKPGINQWNPFRKDKSIFGYQNEFRITFLSENREPVKLDLKQSLRDIAVPILGTDISKIHFANNKLIYPIYSKTPDST